LIVISASKRGVLQKIGFYKLHIPVRVVKSHPRL
jgi:hypothetical protein